MVEEKLSVFESLGHPEILSGHPGGYGCLARYSKEVSSPSTCRMSLLTFLNLSFLAWFPFQAEVACR
jgi:hypothetical protein